MLRYELWCTAKWFDAKAKRPRGWEALGFCGLGGTLNERRLLAHLAGRITLAVPPPEQLNFIEFDLDRHSDNTDTWESVCERLVAIARALKFLPDAIALPVHADSAITTYGDWDAEQLIRLVACLPGVLWRSGSGRRDLGGRRWPGGVRWRICVDKDNPTEELRARVVTLLDAAGVTIEPGYIEMFPHGQKTSRLPLGAGSCILGPDGEPRFAEVKGGRLYRHLGESIMFFSDATRNPVSLPASGVTWASNLSVNTAAGARARASFCESIATGPATKRSRRGRITNPPPQLTERGQRVITSGRFLCYLHTHCGLTWDQAKGPYRSWLSRTDHVGDLSVGNPGRSKLIETMLRDGERDFVRQDRKVDAGQLVKGTAARKGARPARAKRPYEAPAVSIDKLLAHVTREAAEEALTERDAAKIDAVPDVWLCGRLRIFVGYIRVLMELEGPITSLAVTYRAAERIAGTRRPRGWEKAGSINYVHRSRRTGGMGTSPYRIVLRAAQQLGFLGDVIKEGEAGGSATIYAVPKNPNVGDCFAAERRSASVGPSTTAPSAPICANAGPVK